MAQVRNAVEYGSHHDIWLGLALGRRDRYDTIYIHVHVLACCGEPRMKEPAMAVLVSILVFAFYGWAFYGLVYSRRVQPKEQASALPSNARSRWSANICMWQP